MSITRGWTVQLLTPQATTILSPLPRPLRNFFQMCCQALTLTVFDVSLRRVRQCTRTLGGVGWGVGGARHHPPTFTQLIELMLMPTTLSKRTQKDEAGSQCQSFSVMQRIVILVMQHWQRLIQHATKKPQKKRGEIYQIYLTEHHLHHD